MTHLDRLNPQHPHAAKRTRSPLAMLWSIGKDSTVAWLARRFFGHAVSAGTLTHRSRSLR